MSDDINAVLSSFSPAQQEAIKALIAQEAAKNAPPPPRVLTEAEQVERHLALARESLQHAGSSVFFNDRVLSVLETIAAKVYEPATVKESAAVSTDTSTSTEGSAI
jgi:hypothetical protein